MDGVADVVIVKPATQHRKIQFLLEANHGAFSCLTYAFPDAGGNKKPIGPLLTSQPNVTAIGVIVIVISRPINIIAFTFKLSSDYLNCHLNSR